MKDHNEYKEKLSALLDGELNDAERDEVLAHLDTCEACQTYFAELNALRAALGDMEPADVPDGFAAGVMARLHEEDKKPQKTRIRSPWRTWGTLAACAAVVLLAGSMWRFTHMGMGGASDNSASSLAPAAAEPEALMNTTTAAGGPDDTNGFDAPGGALETELYSTESGEEPAMPPADDADGTFYAYDARDAAPEEAYDDAASEKEAPVLTLYGEGAAEWLEENAEPLGEGKWRVTTEAINALPDPLSLLAEDLLQEPVDGTLIITFETTENPQ